MTYQWSLHIRKFDLRGVFTLVGEFVSESVSGHDIRVNNTGTTTSNHGPYTTLGVQHRKFKRDTSGRIELLDVGFLLGQVATERRRPDLYDTNYQLRSLKTREYVVPWEVRDQ